MKLINNVLETHKKIRLWTFQAQPSIRELLETGMLTARWERYSPNDPFKLAYQWMSQQMQLHSSSCEGTAPIWAWHSCGGLGKPPTLADARALLSDLALDTGIQTIELLCPNDQLLLSRYSIWNNILDDFIDHKAEALISPRQIKALFSIPKRGMKQEESIQATLPFIKKEWVVEIRPLILQSNDFDFDRNLIV